MDIRDALIPITVFILISYTILTGMLYMPPQKNGITVDLSKGSVSGFQERVSVGTSTSVTVIRDELLRTVELNPYEDSYLGGLIVLPDHVLGYNFVVIHYLVIYPLIILLSILLISFAVRKGQTLNKSQTK